MEVGILLHIILGWGFGDHLSEIGQFGKKICAIRFTDYTIEKILQKAIFHQGETHKEQFHGNHLVPSGLNPEPADGGGHSGKGHKLPTWIFR